MFIEHAYFGRGYHTFYKHMIDYIFALKENQNFKGCLCILL